MNLIVSYLVLHLRLMLGVALVLITVSSYGMWARMPDTQLISASSLIVKATYIGASTIIIDNKKYYIGVLKIEDTFKGDKQDVVFIRVSPLIKNKAQVSDGLDFKIGQKGIWFLENMLDQENIYAINRPDRFIPEQQFKERLPSLLKLLNQRP